MKNRVGKLKAKQTKPNQKFELKEFQTIKRILMFK